MSPCEELNDMLLSYYRHFNSKRPKFIILGGATYWQLLQDLEPVLLPDGSLQQKAREFRMEKGRSWYDEIEILALRGNTERMELV